MVPVSGPEWDRDKWGPAPPPSPTGVADRERAQRPGRPGLVDAFAVAMLASTLWSAVLYAPRYGWVCSVVAIAIDLPLVYLFWSGRAWMRYLALFVSFIAVLGGLVFFLPAHVLAQLDPSVKIKALFDAAFGVSLLIGLNTRAVRAFFDPR